MGGGAWNLKVETESGIIAARDQVLQTKYVQSKKYIANTNGQKMQTISTI